MVCRKLQKPCWILPFGIVSLHDKQSRGGEVKNNDFMIIYVLVCGIFIGGGIHSTISSQMYKTDKRRKVPVESVYDSQFTGFEWKGHKYLKYAGYDTHYGTHVFNALLHDPDCPCKTNRVEVVE